MRALTPQFKFEKKNVQDRGDREGLPIVIKVGTSQIHSHDIDDELYFISLCHEMVYWYIYNPMCQYLEISTLAQRAGREPRGCGARASHGVVHKYMKTRRCPPNINEAVPLVQSIIISVTSYRAFLSKSIVFPIVFWCSVDMARVLTGD